MISGNIFLGQENLRKKEVEFPGVIRTKSCEISRGQFCGYSRGKTLFCMEFLRVNEQT